MEELSPRALIVGCGYLGKRVATRLLAAGYTVTATTRKRERLEELADLGVGAEILDLSNAASAPTLKRRYAVVVYAVSAGREGDGRLCYREGPLMALEALKERPPEKFLFVSSTGVYAQKDGAEVDEGSPALSEAGNHTWIRSGEEALRQTDLRPRAAILRLGGLYGPARSPIDWLSRPEFHKRLRGSAEAFMNWVHVDDAAAAVVAAAVRGRPGEVYLVVDGSPVRRRDFYAHAARLAGVAPPALEGNTGDLGKRCRNGKMLAELGIVLRYPNYRVGLESL